MIRKIEVFATSVICAGCLITTSSATPLEQQYVVTAPWSPGFGGVNVLTQHAAWHAIGYVVDPGREFVEFHREFIAQADDYRLFGADGAWVGDACIPAAADVDPDPAAIPVVPLPGATLEFAHRSVNTFCRPAGHPE